MFTKLECAQKQHGVCSISFVVVRSSGRAAGRQGGRAAYRFPRGLALAPAPPARLGRPDLGRLPLGNQPRPDMDRLPIGNQFWEPLKGLGHPDPPERLRHSSAFGPYRWRW